MATLTQAEHDRVSVDRAVDDLREQLTARRRALGLSREKLGARMGIAQSHLYRLESGRSRDYTVTTLFLWCRALGVDSLDVRD